MDYIVIGGIDWYDTRSLPIHHVVNILKQNHRVIYVDNFGCVRDLKVSDLKRGVKKLFKRPNHSIRSINKSNSNGLSIIQPVVIPTPRFSNTIGKLNSGLLRKHILSEIALRRFNKPIFWTRVATKIVWEAIKGIDKKLLLYQVVDNFPENPIFPESLKKKHKEYVEKFTCNADIIFTSAKGLYEERKKKNNNTHYFPNGVNVSSFQLYNRANPLKSIKTPIVGFIGTISPPLDFNNLFQVAQKKKDVSFVFVGPITSFADIEKLKNLDNIYFIGPIEHKDIPRYCSNFDIGLIPYELNEFTKYTFPSKFAEYLASGLPVISSNLPELTVYNKWVEFYRDSTELTNQIDKILNKQADKEQTKARRRFAEEFSWNKIVSKMISTIHENITVDNAI